MCHVQPQAQEDLESLTALISADRELSAAQVEDAVRALIAIEVPDAAKAGFLRTLHARGESEGEIAAFARALLERAVDPGIDPARVPGPLIDVCGTGGDQLGTFNVSTAVAFVLAAGGAAVVKHGNRAVTSQSGGADVLEALGIRIELPPEATRRCVEQNGIGFLFAPLYHPAFKAIAPVRRILAAEGTASIFNLLGPLLNPARPDHQLTGVFAARWTAPFAATMRDLGRRRAWAVHGAGGMDELSLAGHSTVSRWDGKTISGGLLRPEDAGLKSVASLEALAGGSAVRNAQILNGILDGALGGAPRDLVLLNAAAAFVITGLANDLPGGVARASEAIDDGGAWRKLEALREFTNR